MYTKFYGILVGFLILVLLSPLVVLAIGEESTEQQWYFQGRLPYQFYMATDSTYNELLENVFIEELAVEDFPIERMSTLGYAGVFFAGGKATQFVGEMDESACYLLTFADPTFASLEKASLIECDIAFQFLDNINSVKNQSNQS